ncbi:hypothetical protein GCM10022198_08570 [Klugiella xanthotipulae]|uniref:Uncharacterized protein n=1 Tax=Klugiella xanthotipulae TaxID=244735 RepID=A0A543I3Q9_9MICO|nr:hypothetical protein [Klugiella xanthotipulae]TQM65229.1 hypothetical protein FB466_0019 [Klugiella xanthotipulae]
MSNDISLFGGGGALTPPAQPLSAAVSRQLRRDLEQVQVGAHVAIAQVAARHQVQQAELASQTALRAAQEHAQSYLTATALSNTAALVSQAKSHAKVTPEAGPFLEAIVTGYVQGTVQRLNKGL